MIVGVEGCTGGITKGTLAVEASESIGGVIVGGERGVAVVGSEVLLESLVDVGIVLVSCETLLLVTVVVALAIIELEVTSC